MPSPVSSLFSVEPVVAVPDELFAGSVCSRGVWVSVGGSTASAVSVSGAVLVALMVGADTGLMSNVTVPKSGYLVILPRSPDTRHTESGGRHRG